MVPLGFTDLDEVHALHILFPFPTDYPSFSIVSHISSGSDNASRNIGHRLIKAGGHFTTQSNTRRRSLSSISRRLSESSYRNLWKKEEAKPSANRGMVNISFSDSGAFPLSEVMTAEPIVSIHRLLAALINSLYSFWWDITNDWGFDLLRSKSTQGEGVRPHPFGLRTRLLYPLPYYPFIVLANLILRLTWSVKLSLHLHSHSEGSGIIFWTEVAELVRRWMWVFLRVEWEILKDKQENLGARECETGFRDD